MSDSADSKIVFRDIEQISEMRAVEQLQKEVWGFSDRDIVPVLTLIPTIEVGGVLVGAFDKERLVGFAYGFIGREKGKLTLHSDMLAVLPQFRSQNLGYKLKLAQRERALAAGIGIMTWTFDPLQSRNAHLNFAKLGVIASRYKIDHYGDESSSFLHQNIGTDRLWAWWELDSARVRQRLQSDEQARMLPPVPRDAITLAGLTAAGPSSKCRLHEAIGSEHLLIEIPADINSLQQQNVQVARRWREITREAFVEALAAGYVVKEFYRPSDAEQVNGAYLLSLEV
jgi:predicted GNAT superfamily acetyltransferase